MISLWTFRSANAAEIAGRVLNGTEGSSLPENLEMVVFAIENTTGEIVERSSGVTSFDGSFLFTDLAEGFDIAYRVVALRESYSPFIDIAPGSRTSDLSLTVWDNNTDPDILRIGNYNLLAVAVNGGERRIAFLASVVIRNDTDMVWVTKPPSEGLTGPDLLRFNLPEGYQNLSVETSLPSGSVLEIGTGFALTTPVPPGEHTVIVSYDATYEETVFSAPFRLAHGADSFSVLVPGEVGQVQGAGLEFAGEVEVPVGENVIVFKSYRGEGYLPSSSVNLSVSGLPQPPLIQRIADSFSGMEYIIGIALVLGLALIALIVVALTKKGQSGLKVTTSGVGALVGSDGVEYGATVKSRREAIRLIAELDELKESSNLSDEDYIARREILLNLALKADPEGKTE